MRGSPGPWLDPGIAESPCGADLGGLLAEPPPHHATPQRPFGAARMEMVLSVAGVG